MTRLANSVGFHFEQRPLSSGKILISGANFGCGSSREHAPWSLADFGIRCIIGSSFADSFLGNCFKNRILCITLAEEQVDKLAARASSDDTVDDEFTVYLDSGTIIAPDGSIISFGLDSRRRDNLLNGLDGIDLNMQRQDKIQAFEERRIREQPWLFA